MSNVGEAPKPPPATGKPVIVRVKRKRNQSCLDAFWLEINESPAKRAATDLGRLSISDSVESNVVGVTKVKKVLVEHVETVISAAASAIVQSFMTAGDDSGERKTRVFRQGNKRESLLSKARQTRQLSSQNARFEQVWRSRQGNKDELDDMCHFYDVLRLDAETTSPAAMEQEEMSLEDQRILSHYLPLLREFVPSAAADIESRVNHNLSFPEDEYVYDYYTMKDDEEMCEESFGQFQFPLVQVEEEDFYDGPDDNSEYDSEDSNAEDHPWNEYPDPTTEEEEEEEKDEEEEDEDGDEEKDEEEESEGEGDGDYYDVDDYVNCEDSDNCGLDGRDSSDYDVEDEDFGCGVAG